MHNETSTGATSRIDEVRRAIDAAKHPALLMVDTISSLASIDYRHDEWGVDVTVCGSQKGLMLPPGLAFNAVSDKALAATKTAKLPKLFLSWEDMLPANKEGYFPYTPATNLLYGLAEAIDMLHEEGLERVFARHDRHAEGVRRAVRAWGLEILVQGAEVLLLLAHGHPACPTATTPTPSARRRWSIRRVARHRAHQGRRQGVPHRSSGRHQRPHHDRHAGGRARWG